MRFISEQGICLHPVVRSGPIISVLLLASLAWAQAPASGDSTPQTKETATSKQQRPAPAPETQQRQLARDGGTSERMLGVVPQFWVVDESVKKPLTPSQKFHLFLRSNTDPFVFVGTALTSGISQAENAHAGYGQGMAGFGKRYGAALADQVDAAFWGGYLLPVLFKEDPRYFRRGHGPIRARAFHAFMATFITRTDKDTHRFNTSNVLGTLIAGGISNAYYPEQDRGFGLTMTSAAVVMLLNGVGTEAEEFYPDIDCHLLHRRRCREQREAADLAAMRAKPRNPQSSAPPAPHAK